MVKIPNYLNANIRIIFKNNNVKICNTCIANIIALECLTGEHYACRPCYTLLQNNDCWMSLWNKNLLKW